MTVPFEFDDLIAKIDDALGELPDHRTGANTQYTIKDAALGAFGAFFTQSPSFLAYQRDLERRQGSNNAHTLFGVENIPSNNQIRNLLDPIAPAQLAPLFLSIFEAFKGQDMATDFQVDQQRWLISLDATQHFSSTRLNCDQCHQTRQKDGQTRYAHHLLSPVIVHPNHNQVLSLPPEFLTPQPDHDKQDCELEAAKRWLARHKPDFAAETVTVLGDALYANQPLCELALETGFDFIFTCKPSRNPHLYEWLEGLKQVKEGLSTVTHRHWNGQYHEIWTYRYVNQVPVRAGEDALLVNWCDLTITHAETGETLYHSAFITNLPLDQERVVEIVRFGRARWKVENEHNNILKTKGYHLEHNFGHGKKHLANFLVTLNLLAFLFHTLFDLFDRRYRHIRQELGPRRTFFNDIRALTRYLVFENWSALLDFMVERLEISLPPPDTTDLSSTR